MFLLILLSDINESDTFDKGKLIQVLLEQLAKEGPIVVVLLLMIILLVYQVYKKEKEIKELNTYIKDANKENIGILIDVTNTLDIVAERQRATNEIVMKEITSLKEFIILKSKNSQ